MLALFTLSYPTDEAVALPSIRTNADEEAALAKKRGIYQGAGDKQHLGGFTELDQDGISPALWRWMVHNLTVHSMIDVGCGKGVSTSWFHTHGVGATCVEGSHDGVAHSLMPAERVVEHDFSRGPWWPKETVDVAWSVEFLEHVGRQYMHNYLKIFEKAAYLFVSHSLWGGWHHVEVHKSNWWRNKLEAMGFVYSEDLTRRARHVAKQGSVMGGCVACRDTIPGKGDGTKESYYRSQHLYISLLVFVNPQVRPRPTHSPRTRRASLPARVATSRLAVRWRSSSGTRTCWAAATTSAARSTATSTDSGRALAPTSTPIASSRCRSRRSRRGTAAPLFASPLLSSRLFCSPRAGRAVAAAGVPRGVQGRAAGGGDGGQARYRPASRAQASKVCGVERRRHTTRDGLRPEAAHTVIRRRVGRGGGVVSCVARHAACRMCASASRERVPRALDTGLRSETVPSPPEFHRDVRELETTRDEVGVGAVNLKINMLLKS